MLLIALALLATIIAGITLPYAITLVANVFQTMISYSKLAQAGTQDDEEFLRSMHAFGVHYSCVGVVLFLGGYLGTALMKITALNQIFKLRQEYLKSALNQDFAYFDLYQTGDFSSKMAELVTKTIIFCMKLLVFQPLLFSTYCILINLKRNEIP
ncbi:multidrug resistance protein pgp-3-like [Ostrinia furnacalis]|uniref:multidrug resistance protein pgp-3-like n=1 Tax=Ostrinia furnacalis TaxID=93504 RepID=UPI00103A7B6A|nr:multidrug resistance protein pgp-3-like [Ostrinia furnacalis]